MKSAPTIKVFYNSACPVCNAGIGYQKKRSIGCNINWQDVHLDQQLVSELGTTLEFARQRLHVIDKDKQLKIGYEAFIVIWENTPQDQWKANLSKIPGARQILNLIYNGFAYCLYNWNLTLKHW